MLMVIVGLLLVSCYTKNKSSAPAAINNQTEVQETAPEQVADPPEEVEEKGTVLSFRIDDTENIGYANVSRMVYRIVLNVDEIPAEKDIKATGISIWENGNSSLDEFTVFAYLPGMPM